jgi:hypothetical protein
MPGPTEFPPSHKRPACRTHNGRVVLSGEVSLNGSEIAGAAYTVLFERAEDNLSIKCEMT